MSRFYGQPQYQAGAMMPDPNWDPQVAKQMSDRINAGEQLGPGAVAGQWDLGRGSHPSGQTLPGMGMSIRPPAGPGTAPKGKDIYSIFGDWAKQNSYAGQGQVARPDGAGGAGPRRNPNTLAGNTVDVNRSGSPDEGQFKQWQQQAQQAQGGWGGGGSGFRNPMQSAQGQWLNQQGVTGTPVR